MYLFSGRSLFLTTQQPFCLPLGENRSHFLLSDSQDEILHLWNSVVELEPPDTSEQKIKVSFILNSFISYTVRPNIIISERMNGYSVVYTTDLLNPADAKKVSVWDFVVGIFS